MPAGAAARTAAGLARRPRRPAARAKTLGAELARVATGRSQLRPAPGDRRFADGRGSTNPLLRSLLQALPRGGRRGRRPDRRRRAGLARRAPGALRGRQRARRAGADELPADQPRRPARDRRPRRDEPGARRPALVRDVSRSPRLPASVDTSELLGRREPGDERGLGRPAHRRVRADPVPAAHARGPRGPDVDRPADDQQVLRARPRARAQPGRAPARRGPAGVRGLVAQPRRRARALGPRHVRRGRPRGTRGDGGDHRVGVRAPDRGVLGRDHQRGRARAPRRPRRREPDAARVRARQRARRHGVGARGPRGRGGGRRRVRAQGLPRRPRARRRVRLAAPERPDLGLRRQQLPDGPPAAGVRRPLLEPGHGPPRRGPAPRLRADRARELAHARGRGRGAGRARRPLDDHRRHLRGRRPQRPPGAVGERATAARCCSAARARFVLSTSGHIQALVNPPRPTAGRPTASPPSTAARPETGSTPQRSAAGSWWPDW